MNNFGANVALVLSRNDVKDIIAHGCYKKRRIYDLTMMKSIRHRIVQVILLLLVANASADNKDNRFIPAKNLVQLEIGGKHALWPFPLPNISYERVLIDHLALGAGIAYGGYGMVHMGGIPEIVRHAIRNVI